MLAVIETADLDGGFLLMNDGEGGEEEEEEEHEEFACLFAVPAFFLCPR